MKSKNDEVKLECSKCTHGNIFLRALGNPIDSWSRLLLACFLFIGIYYFLREASSILFDLFMTNFTSGATAMNPIYESRFTDWLIFMFVPSIMSVYYIVYKVSPKLLISIKPGFRWGWFIRCLVVVVPISGILIIGQSALEMESELVFSNFTIASVLITVVMSFLQSAGEEFVFRAGSLQIFSTVIKSNKWAWILLCILISIIFALMHNPNNFPATLDLFATSLLMFALVYYTGGIEASIVLHSANNLFLNLLTDFSNIGVDFNASSDSSGGDLTGTLVVIGLNVAITLLVMFMWNRYQKKV